MRKRIRRLKVRKVVGWDKDSLIAKAKLHMQAKQSKEFIHYLPPAGKRPATFLENMASSHVAGTWEGKCHKHECQCHPFLLLCPTFYCSTQCHMVWNIPLVSWDHLSWLCPLPVSCAAPSLVRNCEKQKALTLCNHWWATAETSVCYEHYFGQRHHTNCKEKLTPSQTKLVQNSALCDCLLIL